MNMLSTLFGSRIRAKLLGWLMTHPDERYFVRQFTGLINEDSTNVSRELTRLSNMGILTSQQEGRQKYYQVNRHSPVFEELRGLVIKTVGIGDIIRSSLEQQLENQIEIAFIYGSFTTGEATAASDVDIMIIGDAKFGAITRALRAAQETLGREVNPIVYPIHEFIEKVQIGNNFVNRVLKGKKIFLIGDGRELARLAGKPLAE